MEPTTTGDGSTLRDWRHLPMPVWLWTPIALGPALWLLYLSPHAPVGIPHFDWGLYTADATHWFTTGTPYVVPPGIYNPYVTTAYTYPPPSWPLLILAAVAPAAIEWVAILPLLARPPSFWLAPPSAGLLTFGLAEGLWLGNVSIFMAGLLVLSFRGGRIGGLAFAGAVALRLYPIALLPLLWSDGVRLRWFLGSFAALVVSGTLLLGIAGWLDWALIIAREATVGTSWNPFGWMGLARIVPALATILLGLRLKSPTVTLLGATWLGAHVTNHYLVTIAAVLPFEGWRNRSTGSHRARLPINRLKVPGDPGR